MKWIVFILLFAVDFVSAEEKLKNFRGTNQKLALVDAFNEFVEPPVVERLLNDLRKTLNKYSRSYGSSTIASFKGGTNPQNVYYKPTSSLLSDSQKTFLQAVSKDNSIDILVLTSLKGLGEEVEVQLQLYDARIETLSKIEEGAIALNASQRPLELLAFRVMNYLDKDGYVHDTPQDFLAPPLFLKDSSSASTGFAEEDFSVNPQELGGGNLAGRVSIGGEKTPFWETWWFWTLIGGGLLTGGGLAYYFLVYNVPPDKANIDFDVPVPTK